MPYVNVPNDLSKVKTKMGLNLTKRQFICFGCAAAVGVPIAAIAQKAHNAGHGGGLKGDHLLRNGFHAAPAPLQVA